MLLVWGTRDTVVPRQWIDADQKVISGAQGATIARGHRPEIEREGALLRAVNEVLS